VAEERAGRFFEGIRFVRSGPLAIVRNRAYDRSIIWR